MQQAVEPRIEICAEKKLVGKRLTMTLAHDTTFALWQSFMPQRKHIANLLSADLFCVQVYQPSLDPTTFNQNTAFEKWAVAEVSDFDNIPAGLESLHLPGGLYAVFLYKGASDAAAETFRYIFETWLPGAAFTLDNRPHFEWMGAKYKNGHPDSEEEFWIPVKPK